MHLILGFVVSALLWVGPARAQSATPTFSQDAETLFQRALARYIKENFTGARETLLELLDQTPLNQRTSAARLLLAKSHYKLRDYNEALAASIELYEHFPYSRYLPDADLLIGDCYFRQNQIYSASTQYARVLTSGGPTELKARAADRLGQMVGTSRLTDRDIIRLRADFGQRIVDEAVAFGQARWPAKLGQAAEADKRLAVFLERFPNGYLEPLVRRRLLASTARSPLETEEEVLPTPAEVEEDPTQAKYKIGIIAPLESAVGQNLRDGILLARERFPLSSGQQIGLIFQDSEGSPIRAVKAAERIVEQYDVIAIIGALSSLETIPLAAHLSPQGVPLIAPTASTDEIASLPAVFQMNATPGAQGRRLADYAVGGMGHRTLATLAPRDPYGNRLAREFTTRAEELGGEVIVQEWFEPGATDYRGQFSRIRDAGLALRMPESFEADIDDLLLGGLQIAPPPPVPVDPDTVQPEEVKTIDALLVGASSAEDVLLITPQVASALIDAQLLGSDGWNFPEVARDGGNYVDNAVFVAKYHDQSSLPSVQEFVNLYRARFGRDQDIAAALGHDAMRAAREAIERGGTDRSSFVQQLQALQDIPGATGRVTFRPGDRENAWMYTLKLRRGRIEPLQEPEPPESP